MNGSIHSYLPRYHLKEADLFTSYVNTQRSSDFHTDARSRERPPLSLLVAVSCDSLWRTRKDKSRDKDRLNLFSAPASVYWETHLTPGLCGGVCVWGGGGGGGGWCLCCWMSV